MRFCSSSHSSHYGLVLVEGVLHGFALKPLDFATGLPQLTLLGKTKNGAVPKKLCVLCLLVRDAFDHDKGQLNLQFRGADFLKYSPVDLFVFSPGFLCNLVKKSPQNEEKIARFLGG